MQQREPKRPNLAARSPLDLPVLQCKSKKKCCKKYKKGKRCKDCPKKGK